MTGELSQFGLFLRKIAFQFAAQLLELQEIGFQVLGEYVLEPLSHSLRQDGRLAIRTDRNFHRTIGHDSPHVKVTSVWDIGNVQKMALEATQRHGPADLPRFDGRHNADVVSTDLPRPSSPPWDELNTRMCIGQSLDWF